MKPPPSLRKARRMARVTVQLPEQYPFSCEIPVRIIDINYGNHLGNDAFLGILHEARALWLRRHGWTELEMNGCSLIMVDVAIRFKSEAVHGDVLRVHLAIGDCGRFGFDLIYLAAQAQTGKEVARARTGMLFFDYARRARLATPEWFREMSDLAMSNDEIPNDE